MSKRGKQRQPPKKPVVSDDSTKIMSLTNKVDGLYDLVAQQSKRITYLESEVGGLGRDYQAHLHGIQLITGPKQFSPEVDRMIQEQRKQGQDATKAAIKEGDASEQPGTKETEEGQENKKK